MDDARAMVLYLEEPPVEPGKDRAERVDLCDSGLHVFALLMQRAVLLGSADHRAGNRERSGQELASLWATSFRKGHAAALRTAYKSGRFHVLTQEAEQASERAKKFHR